MSFAGELADALGFFPAPIVVFLLAMSPVGEVRMSIPVGMLVFKMGWAEAFTWSLMGNLLVVPLLVWALPAFDAWAMKSERGERWLTKIYTKTRKKTTEKMEKYQEFSLFLLIATPVPGTGAWTGVIGAHIFGVPLKQGAPYYYAGVVAACFIAAGLVQAGLLVV